MILMQHLIARITLKGYDASKMPCIFLIMFWFVFAKRKGATSLRCLLILKRRSQRNRNKRHAETTGIITQSKYRGGLFGTGDAIFVTIAAANDSLRRSRGTEKGPERLLNLDVMSSFGTLNIWIYLLLIFSDKSFCFYM